LLCDCQELDALAAQLVRLGAEVPAANSQAPAAAAAAGGGGGSQNQPPLAESDSDSEDQLPTAADGSLLVSEPPQPLYVILFSYFSLFYLCLPSLLQLQGCLKVKRPMQHTVRRRGVHLPVEAVKPVGG